MAFHFAPTSTSRINQVERWFAELTRKQLQRDTRVSTRQFKADIHAFIDKYNQDPKPFMRIESAADTFAVVKHFNPRVGYKVLQECTT